MINKIQLSNVYTVSHKLSSFGYKNKDQTRYG